MKLRYRYRKLSFWNKIAFWGALASLLALVAGFFFWLFPSPFQRNKSLTTQEAQTREVQRATITSAAAELEQIATNLEEWAENERKRFTHGVNSSDVEKWMNNWLTDSYVAGLFNYPVPRQANGLFPNESKKDFRLIVDTFQLYNPSIADSLKDTYDSFLRSINRCVQQYEYDKQKDSPIFTRWCISFLDNVVVPTSKRLRHIANMAKEDVAADVP